MSLKLIVTLGQFPLLIVLMFVQLKQSHPITRNMPTDSRNRLIAVIFLVGVFLEIVPSQTVTLQQNNLIPLSLIL